MQAARGKRNVARIRAETKAFITEVIWVPAVSCLLHITTTCWILWDQDFCWHPAAVPLMMLALPDLKNCTLYIGPRLRYIGHSRIQSTRGGRKGDNTAGSMLDKQYVEASH